MIAERVTKEINARLGLPARRRPRLPHAVALRRHARRRRGPAHPPGVARSASGLVGVLYVLDEPSIGLHQRDNRRLIDTLIRLRDLGNTVLVVEHDEDTITEADYIVDIGPGAGEHGGDVVYTGPVKGIAEGRRTRSPASTSRQAFDPRARAAPRARRRLARRPRRPRAQPPEHRRRIPLGCFVAVTGVSRLRQVARSSTTSCCRR